MSVRNRAQVRLKKDLEELQNDPPYVITRILCSDLLGY